MPITTSEHDQTGKKPTLKIIVLCSNYNELQEGNEDYHVVPITQEIGNYICNPQKYPYPRYFSPNHLYYAPRINFENKVSEIRYVVFTQDRTAKIGTIPISELRNYNGVSLSDDIKAQIQEIARSHGHLERNPFVTTAYNMGYRIDVESVDNRKIPDAIWTPEASGETPWGKVTRTQANLQPTPENKAALDGLVEKWKQDIETYDGVVFINTDGDGAADKMYWPLYFEFEASPKVYFADWCTCCTPPMETSHYFRGRPDRYAMAKECGLTTIPKSRVSRSMDVALEEDFQAWIEHLTPSQLLDAGSAQLRAGYRRYGFFRDPLSTDASNKAIKCQESYQALFESLEALSEFDKKREIVSFLMQTRGLSDEIINQYAGDVVEKYRRGLPAAVEFVNTIQKSPVESLFTSKLEKILCPSSSDHSAPQPFK